MALQLSPDQCVLLTVHYASEGNIPALHSFTPSRLDALSPELILRVLLTYLPESIDPREYTTYVSEVASRLYLDVERQDVEVDVSPVADIGEAQARKKVAKLDLLPLRSATFPPHAPKDLLTSFICTRAFRIDDETGMLSLLPHLIEPFLSRTKFLRTWYISMVLPLLRLELDYYPSEGESDVSLAGFSAMDGMDTVEFLLRNNTDRRTVTDPQATSTAAVQMTRDIKSLVGPWMYGRTERQKRRLDPNADDADEDEQLATRLRKVSLSGVTKDDITGDDWEHLYRWLVYHASDHFLTIAGVIDVWDGPRDVDLGGLNPGNSDAYLDADVLQKLELQYTQMAFASCYAVTTATLDVIRAAHSILARLAEILDFIPPPDLATSVEALPKIERHTASLDESRNVSELAPDALLKPEHPLTTPRMETYMLLQMVVYSAYQLSDLGASHSLVEVVRLLFYATQDELLTLFRKILRGLETSGARKNDDQWASDRAKLIWLWNWGIDPESQDATQGAGILGKIPREDFEAEMLRCFIDTNCYAFATELYLTPTSSNLPRARVEQIALEKAMEAYDGATNGNKTRGGMKKANDIVSTFRPFFADSQPFRQAMALIAATHALSYYSLTLQHGVPFQPVSIRVSSDPVGLLSKVLEQNPRSYTKLDDLISIGRNLVSAGLPQASHSDGIATSEPITETDTKSAERRISFMAIESALREDDFETAYSYIVSRLSPSSADITAPVAGDTPVKHKRNISTSSTRSTAAVDDDISWRAAFLAGRYRPASSAPSLRRLEQRTELLSLALLLAPTSALTEILAAWRRCEEETTAMQQSTQAIEQALDDRADRRIPASALPGNFSILAEDDGVTADQPPMLLGQRRREMGRMAGRSAADADAPVSMFDLTRSAASAFRQNAWVGRGAGPPGRQAAAPVAPPAEEDHDAAGQRVRKRDMVASAASGALASGLGWMLGATPVAHQPEQREEHD